MKRSSSHSICAVALLFCGAVAHAQLPAGRLSTVFPAGGQRGTEFSVKLVSFGDLDESSGLWFSHTGITAAGASAGSTEFKVKVDASVPPGFYEVRAVGLFGMTNPRLFAVGLHEEHQEKEPNDTRATAGATTVNATTNGVIGRAGDVDWYRFKGRPGTRAIIRCVCRAIDSPLSPSVEVFTSAGRRVARVRGHGNTDVVTDILLSSDADYFVSVSDVTFTGNAESVYRLTIQDTPHIDFVTPAAVQPGTTSRVTVFGRNLPGGIDEPADGAAALQRLEVDIQAPTDANSLGVTGSLTSDRSNTDGFMWQLPNSNPVLVRFATAAPVVESEPNDDSSKAQELKIPADVTGQFQKPADVDCFVFAARKGDRLLISADATNSASVDPWFTLEQIQVNDKGVEQVKRITTQDDNGSNIGGNDFLTANTNSRYSLSVPADGRYRLHVRDRYGDSRGEPGLLYRLRIARPSPDFRLVALAGKPAAAANQPYDQGAVVLRRGGNHEVTVFAHRRGGFAEPIQVSAADLPPDVDCRSVWIPAGQSRATLVLTATEDAAPVHKPIRIIGSVAVRNPEKIAAVEAARKQLAAAADAAARVKATTTLKAAIQAETSARTLKSHEARTATIVRKRNGAASLARLTQGLVLSVLKGTAPLYAAAQPGDAPHELHVNQSQQVLLPIQLAKRNGFDQNVNVTFTGQPGNTDVENKPIPKGQTAGVFRLFLKPNVAPGTYTLLPRAQAAVPFRRNPWKLEREQAAHAKVVQQVTDATAAVKVAKDQKTAQAARVADLEKDAAAGPPKIKAADAEIEKQQKVVATAEGTEKTAGTALAAARKRTTARRTAAGILGKALASAPTDPDLIAQKAQADKLVSSAKAEEATAMSTLEKQKASVAAARLGLTQVRAKKAQLQKDLGQYPAMIAAAKKQIVAKDNMIKAAEAKLASANAAKAEADKRLKAVQTETRPQNVNVYEPVTPVVLHVAKAPLTLAATVPGGGNLKRGQSIEIEVKLKRTEHAGPVNLSIVTPDGVKGLTTKPFEIPAGADAGKVGITAAADTPEGVLRNCVVRATVDADRTYHVDAPIKVQVVK